VLTLVAAPLARALQAVRQAEELLVDLRTDATAAIAEIRRIVVGLRPPALDELGLVEAVRQETVRFGDARGRSLMVQVADGTPLPPLPAALEVAAYRVAVEAIVNAARHSDAAEVTATFDATAALLTVTVLNDGASRNGGAWRPGVGLASMRERCEQVGGSLAVGPTPTGGRVEAVLPLG